MYTSWPGGGGGGGRSAHVLFSFWLNLDSLKPYWVQLSLFGLPKCLSVRVQLSTFLVVTFLLNVHIHGLV